jgi:hypothetical protein
VKFRPGPSIVIGAAAYLLGLAGLALSPVGSAAQVQATGSAPAIPVPCDAFTRDADGAWTATRAAVVAIGSARVSVAANTTYRRHAINVNGVDFSDYLDAHCDWQNKPH